MLYDEKKYEDKNSLPEPEIIEETLVEEIPAPVEPAPVEEEPSVYDSIIGTISSEVAYMRKKPTKSGEINLFLKKGDTVIITADGDVGNYYLVTAQAKVGYVLKNDITIK